MKEKLEYSKIIFLAVKKKIMAMFIIEALLLAACSALLSELGPMIYVYKEMISALLIFYLGQSIYETTDSIFTAYQKKNLILPTVVMLVVANACAEGIVCVLGRELLDGGVATFGLAECIKRYASITAFGDNILLVLFETVMMMLAAAFSGVFILAIEKSRSRKYVVVRLLAITVILIACSAVCFVTGFNVLYYVCLPFSYLVRNAITAHALGIALVGLIIFADLRLMKWRE